MRFSRSSRVVLLIMRMSRVRFVCCMLMTSCRVIWLGVLLVISKPKRFWAIWVISWYRVCVKACFEVIVIRSFPLRYLVWIIWSKNSFVGYF